MTTNNHMLGGQLFLSVNFFFSFVFLIYDMMK